MNGCGCNYWKELIKSAWGLATTSVRAVKTKDETKYPDGDGLIDLSDISGGGEGTVTSVNGKQPDAQGNVAVGSADIATPDGTVQGDIETLGANLASEIAARTSGDESLRNAIAGKQDALTSAQQEAVDSGITKAKVASYSMTTQNLTRLGTRVDTIDDSVIATQSDISQLKISDAEHTETLADQATQLSAQASEITAIKTKDASQDSSISALQTKTATHDTEIQGLSESVVSDLTGTFTDSTRTLKLSLERESAPSIDCSVVIPGGTGGGDVTSVNGKTGAVTIGASDVLSTAQLNAANSGITSAKVGTYDGYATTIAGKQDKLTPGSNITISGNTISATDTKYTLPTASASVLGGVKVGSGLSISNGVLSATGGGGGGGSLPANGYYWEKVTSDNWPNDWTNTDIIMISPSKYQYLTNKSWDEAITYSSAYNATGSRQSWVITKIYTYTDTIYYNSITAGGIAFNTLSRVEEPSYWNEKSSSRILVQLKFTAFNGTGTSQHTISNMLYSDVVKSGLYRLRKFS